MGIEDDIAASLPTPPYPAPAQRAAAIERALRRFDGIEEAAPAPGLTADAARSGPFRLAGRPYAGALLSLALVAVIGVPVAWDTLRERPGSVEQRPPAVPEMASRFEPRASGAAAKRVEPVSPSLDAHSEVEGASEPVASPAPAAPAPVVLAEAAPPVPVRAPMEKEQADRFALNRAEEADASADDQIVITGARRTLQSAQSIKRESATTVDSIVISGIRAVPRGDWNACTVDDPSRDLSACGRLVDPGASGPRGRAAAHLADGLALAWRGELDPAIAAFDRAIAIAPRLEFAYVNRAIARRRNGDLRGALADLDKAVRYAPRSARAYYNRALVLEQRGSEARAEADRGRAVSLDPAYMAVAQ